jgi:methylenetetrahydrofolate--tRNA-(uracil-5-)-methyltransferase
VDRESFAKEVTQRLNGHPNVEIVREEITSIPWIGVPVVIATGPLTTEALSTEILKVTNTQSLYFFDAAAPIVHRESIDESKVFSASRYEKGGSDYINCPMNKEEYMAFWHELKNAKLHPLHHFENDRFFEGCMPVEELAKRGEKTLLFGPLKPVGLTDPHTGERPFAVVQLRQDDAAGRLYNLVGFQTRLKWPEQKRVFRMIPGLENAEFARYGVMHQNSYIDSPRFLLPTLQAKQALSLLFAGQLTGVEGYVESAANGLVAGINAARISAEKEPLIFPAETAHGALCHYITTSVAESFQPMNITFGLMPDLVEPVRDRKERRHKLSERALRMIRELQTKNLDDWQ